MTFIFKLTKIRASTLMNICPHKEKLKKGQKKWPKWYSNKLVWAYCKNDFDFDFVASKIT